MTTLNKELISYIEENILPLYDNFDSAHQRNHAMQVIDRSLKYAKPYDLNLDMVYAIAAYHDTGLTECRETHHTASKRIMLNDNTLHRWFDKSQVAIMGDAVEDHRASSGHEPRSIYGKIVAEADRLINPTEVITRTIQFGLDHYPQYDTEGQYTRFREHLLEKYSDHGYIRLWLPESDNAQQLEILRTIIRDERKLREAFDNAYDIIWTSK